MLKIFLWGTGNIAKEVLNNYAIFERYDVLGFIDSDSNKWGKYQYGKRIYAPEVLLTVKVNKIVILTVKYHEIYEQITKDLKIKDIEIEDWKYFERQITVKQRLLKRYKNIDDKEIREILNYLKQNDLDVFNYYFKERYKDFNINVVYDKICKMFYVIHQGKKMYFPKRMSKEEIIEYYKSILWEQDKESPHRYLDDDFDVHYGDVVVDAGVAEGNFALEVIDRVSKIYLIEADNGWVEALKETFRKYRDKVFIISKYLTSFNDDNYTTLDDLIMEPINFIKMDIEGNEWDALLGAEKTIKQSRKIRCAICAYHFECDEILIKTVLKRYGMQCSTTRGYMWFYSQGRNGEMSSKLCRGIVRGIK